MLRLASAGALFALLLLGPIVAMASAPGVQFVGPDLTLSVPAGAPAQFDITVVNGSSGRETLSIWSAPAGAGASPAPPLNVATGGGEPTVSTAPTTTAAVLLVSVPKVPAGKVITVHIDAGTPSTSASFTLIVTSTDGSTDKRTISIAVTPQTTTPSYPPGVVPLSTPMPATVVMRAVTFGIPSNPHVYVDPAVVSRVTPLYGADGQGVAPSYNPATGEITVPNLPGHGKYVGSIIGTDSKPASTLELDVRHGLLFPVIVVLLGLLAGFLVQSWLTAIRPTLALAIDTGELRERAATAIADERKRLDELGPNALVSPPEPVAVYGATVPSWLGTEIDRAATAVERAATADKADVAAKQRDALDAIYLAQGDVWATSDAIRAAFWRIPDGLPPVDAAAFAAGPLAFEVSQALAGYTARSKDVFDATATAWNTLLAALGGLDDRVEELKRLATAGVPSADTAPLLARLARLPQSTGDEVTTLAKDIRALWDKVPPPGGPRAALAGPTELWISAPPTPSLSTTAGMHAGAPLLAAQPRAWLVAGDRVYLLSIALIAILTGLNTNYAPNATFGSSTDYLTLFLWGFSVELLGELVKGVWGRLIPIRL
jgi:hypothetical protein